MLLDHPNDLVNVLENNRLVEDFTGALVVALSQEHHALTDGGHLRPAIVVDDCRDDVAPERRSNLKQQIAVLGARPLVFVVANIQISAVGRQTGSHLGGHARCQVPTERSCPVEHDLRFVFVDQPAHHPCVRKRAVMF